MLLSIFPVESSFSCEHGTHEYAGYKRSKEVIKPLTPAWDILHVYSKQSVDRKML